MKPVAAGFSFRVLAEDGLARRAEFDTPHGLVQTPTFMPVGTQGTVKTLTPEEVASTGATVVLGNTYHLMLRPGAETVAGLGGLHAFTRWRGPMLTDSGGFQAYSLSRGDLSRGDGKQSSGGGPPKQHTTEDGFTFKSHLDGSTHALTPEGAVRVQGLLGADVQMQLDVCPPGESPEAVVEAACARTTRWAKRALSVERPPGQALFGIVQGACFARLRRSHAEDLGAMAFDGLALGGFSVGEPAARMHETLPEVVPSLDPERPRYLMGVGTPLDLILAIGAGVDMFDCVLPTRNARNGQALTRFGRVVVKQAAYKDDPRPIDDACSCACCAKGYSRAYLRHLFLAGEILVLRLLSLHNLHFYGSLVSGARRAIEARRFGSWSKDTIAMLEAGAG